MQLNSNQTGKGTQYLFYLGVYLFFLFLSYNTPLTGDDWTWGTKAGWSRLQNGFADYNGRYISNILELAITRIDILRYLIVALFSTLLIFLIAKITNHRNTLIPMMLSFIMILLTPTKIFAQTFGWAAGFINYVPSLALLLLYVYIVRNIYSEDKPIYNKWLPLFIFPLGLATQLIVEHVTLFALYTAVAVILYTYFKHKKVMVLHLTYLVSLIVGSIIMFSNGAYWNVLNGTDTYRAVGNEITEEMGILAKIYYVYSEQIYKYLFLENIFINLIIGILIIILITRSVSNSNWIGLVIKPLLLSIIIGSMLYLLVVGEVLGNEFLGTKTNDFEAFICTLFFMSILVSIALFVDIQTYKIRLFYYLSGVVLLIAPFIFISPFGPRCVFASYVFMVLVCLELFSYLTNSSTFSYKKLIKPLLATIFVLIIGYAYIFAMNGSTSRERLLHLKEEVNKKEQKIELQELPFTQFHWMTSPIPNLYQTETFKVYYGVPKNTEIEIIPYDQWIEK